MQELFEDAQIAHSRRLRKGPVLKATRTRLRDGLALLTIALAAVRLVPLYPSAVNGRQADSWRERDYAVWWWSQQLFHCEPDDLHDWQLELVKDWHRCQALIGKYHNSGLSSLNDDECRFVIKILDEVHPLSEYREGSNRIRAIFARRLDSHGGSSS